MPEYIVEAQDVSSNDKWDPITSHNKIKTWPSVEAADQAMRKMPIRKLFNLRVRSTNVTG